MRAREFCEAIARELPAGYNRDDVAKVLDAMSVVSKRLLNEGDEVRFPGFGKLFVRSIRGVWRPYFRAFVKYEEEFRSTFVMNRDKDEPFDHH